MQVVALAQRESHVFGYGERIEERAALENHGDFLADALHFFFGVVGDVFVGDDDASRVGVEEAENGLQGDGFANAAASEDADGFGVFDVEADVVEDVLVAEGFGDVAELDVGGGGLWRVASSGIFMLIINGRGRGEKILWPRIFADLPQIEL